MAYEGLIISALVFIALGIISYIGARYTVKYDRSDALIGVYVLFLTCAQFFATKVAEFDFGIITWVAPAGIIVFPFTLQLTDMVNEKYGREEVYKMIWIALVSQIVMVFFIEMALLPPDHFGNDPLSPFSAVFRITVASWIAFFISERFDAWLYDAIRQRIANHLWIRNVFSDVLSLGLDSLIFTPIAFFGVVPDFVLMDMIVGQLATKWILGLIDTPFMYLTRWVYNK